MYDGLWTVEFISTINRFGRGVLVLSNGRLLGGDAGYYYTGNYEITANRIKGTVKVTRYDTNSISIIGDVEQYTLIFSGEVQNYHFSAAASVMNKPEYQIRIVGNKKEDI